ncbi:MAG: TonB-dependent receptor plug domain-containing protein, partial [Phenylobacterium sp.]|nr:TonB-dependent receptor plug domain-containing protein [Phenylobacterium sp.]
MKHAFAQVSLLALVAGLAAAPAYAQGDAEATAVDEVVITGTRRADVTALSSVTPIDVVSADALETSGSPTLVQSLRTLVPSVSFSQVGGIIGARLANSVSLRGLPAGNTLVLVNGKRRNPTAKVSTGNEWSRGSQPVDLNDIPLEAVARVEVL